jgi:hypothetical protein
MPTPAALDVYAVTFDTVVADISTGSLDELAVTIGSRLETAATSAGTANSMSGSVAAAIRAAHDALVSGGTPEQVAAAVEAAVHATR